MSTTRRRRPLPRRVYWVRRLGVLAVAFALVFSVAHLLGGGGGDAGTPAARQVGADVGAPSSAKTPAATGPTAPGARHSRSRRARKPRAVKTPLAIPTGPCADSDVLVRPSVEEAYAGRDVRIALFLTAADSPACNWEVTARSVVLKVTSGSDRVWSTQDCPRAVEPQSVVVRKGHETQVQVVWNGQRSDAECSRTTGWALPGYYHAEAAALGAEPTDQQFYLAAPPRPTITPRPKPRQGLGGVPGVLAEEHPAEEGPVEKAQSKKAQSKKAQSKGTQRTKAEQQ